MGLKAKLTQINYDAHHRIEETNRGSSCLTLFIAAGTLGFSWAFLNPYILLGGFGIILVIHACAWISRATINNNTNQINRFFGNGENHSH